MKAKFFLITLAIFGFVFNSNAQIRVTKNQTSKVVIVHKKKNTRNSPTKIIKKKNTVLYRHAPVNGMMVRETKPSYRKSFHFKAK